MPYSFSLFLWVDVDGYEGAYAGGFFIYLSPTTAYTHTTPTHLPFERITLCVRFHHHNSRDQSFRKLVLRRQENTSVSKALQNLWDI